MSCTSTTTPSPAQWYSCCSGSQSSPRSALGHLDYHKVVSFGLALFLVVLALIVAGLSQASMGLFLAGTAVGGIAVGCVFMGSLSIANRLAPAERRGQVVSSYFVFCYLGLTIPVIGVGISSEHFGIFRSVLVCSIALAALSVLSLGALRRDGVVTRWGRESPVTAFTTGEPTLGTHRLERQIDLSLHQRRVDDLGTRTSDTQAGLAIVPEPT